MRTTLRSLAGPSLVAGLTCLTLAASGRAPAQTSYIPRAPESDTLLYPETKKDPRIAPRDAHNPVSRDPRVPKNEPQPWVNRDYFAIATDPEAFRLIPIVENGHLGPKTNPRGFWPRFTKGEHQLAVAELKYVLWVFPNHPRALHLLGMMAKQMKDTSIPIAFYEKALRLFPDRAYTRAQYGAYLVDVGDRTQGLLHLEKALQMNPSDLVARAWLDKARRELGIETGAAGVTAPAASAAETHPMQQDGMYVPRR
jgi:tetratricopeptide (TPR) repeat protein